MNPFINSTSFGSITIDGTEYSHDVIIHLDGKISKRKKKLSKKETGSSHLFSEQEAKHIYQSGTGKIILGTGQNGVLKVSDEAMQYFEKKHCTLEICPTPRAIEYWNKESGPIVGLFHVTC
ncbi:MAG: MTH938/NDUFAF3 family protein [candidate division KSB1 bacterium]|nr:MTH938/NDUFAF3 family protein [candidate division KSB1 bacterium]